MHRKCCGCFSLTEVTVTIGSRCSASGKVCLLSLVGKSTQCFAGTRDCRYFHTHTRRNVHAGKCTKCSNSLCTDMQFKMCIFLENTFCASHRNPPPAAILKKTTLCFCIVLNKGNPNQSRSVTYVTVVHQSISMLHIRQ